jgi:3-phytase
VRTHHSRRRAAAVASGTALITLLAAFPAGARAAGLPVVTATSETAALYDDEAGGNADADDPAIWRNAADPGRSLVVATAKEGGLRVYDLDARLVQSLPAPQPPAADDAPGRFNNVDVVSGLRTPSGRPAVADGHQCRERGERLRQRVGLDQSVAAPGRRPSVSAHPALSRTTS